MGPHSFVVLAFWRMSGFPKSRFVFPAREHLPRPNVRFGYENQKYSFGWFHSRRPKNICFPTTSEVFFSIICVYPSLAWGRVVLRSWRSGECQVSSKYSFPNRKVDLFPAPEGAYPDHTLDLLSPTENIWLLGWFRPSRPKRYLSPNQK